MDSFRSIELGPCVLDYGGFEINHTIGGVTVRVEPMMKDIKTDQLGESIVDQRIVGWNVRAVVPMAQSDYLSLKAVATFTDADPTDAWLEDRKLGTSMRELGQALTLHPTGREALDTSADIDFYLAIPVGELELPYSFANEKVYNVEFLALPKSGFDTAEPGNFFMIGAGDPAAGYLVTFTCQDAATDPVPGVVITLAGLSKKLVTDAAGQATINLPDDTYIYLARLAPYNDSTDDFTVDGADEPVAVTMTI
jgi:hypothetical protein